jgi:hypothetical protein
MNIIWHGICQLVRRRQNHLPGSKESGIHAKNSSTAFRFSVQCAAHSQAASLVHRFFNLFTKDTVMAKIRYWTNPQLIIAGRRYGADAVAWEAGEALAGYGCGQGALDAFAADFAEQGRLRSSRPEALAEKKMSVATRNKHVSKGWAWVDRVTSMLAVPARTDQTLATALDSSDKKLMASSSI